MKLLPDRIVCLVTDLERAGGEGDLLRTVSDAVLGGVNMVQVRAHYLSGNELISLAERTVEAVAGSALVVVNGTPKIAVGSGADGVHLRESASIPSYGERADLLLGRSVHSLESAMRAEANGVDYLVLGTIFPSRSHPGGVTGGLELVRAVSSAAALPVIGIGGIDARNAREVIAAGASGVAVIGAIIDSEHPRDAANELAEAIGIGTAEQQTE